MGVLFSRPEPVAPFAVATWVENIQEAILELVRSSSKPIKYAEIGQKLGLNETCISKTKFKDTVIMLLCEDLVGAGLLEWSKTVGRPYLVPHENAM